jgi:WXG100 family type VII secretion target
MPPQRDLDTHLPTMQQASTHVHDVSQQIYSQLTSFMNRLEPLKSAWQGDAAGSFEELKTHWHDNATKLNNALNGIGEALKQSHQQYGSTEDANVHEVKKVHYNLH